MKTQQKQIMAFTEGMELTHDTPSMNTYRHINHKNGSDAASNGVGSQRGGGNDAKGGEQHHVVSKYDTNSRNNNVNRCLQNNNNVSKCLQNEVNNNHNQMVNHSDHLKFYKTKMCPWHFNGRCIRAAGCSYAHCESELRPVFKTKMCDYIADGSCPHGGMCIFAHSSEELKPRLNTGDFHRNDSHEQQQQPKNRQRNSNLTSMSDIQMRDNFREDQQRERASREFHPHDVPKTKLLAKAKLGNTFFQQKNKYNNHNRNADDQHRCAASAQRNFDSDATSYEYGRSTSTMDSMSGPVIANCDSEKFCTNRFSSPSSGSDSAIVTPFSPISPNAPSMNVVGGSSSVQRDSCNSPGQTPSTSCPSPGPPHLSLPSPGSSPVTMPAYLSGMGAPSPIAHYWLQYANAAYIASGNDMLVHHSLFRGDIPMSNGYLNMNGSSHPAQMLQQQINVQPHSDIPNISDHNMLMQGNFNASVEELNAARPSFYED